MPAGSATVSCLTSKWPSVFVYICVWCMCVSVVCMCVVCVVYVCECVLSLLKCPQLLYLVERK